MNEEKKPLLFISHKYVDRNIADTVATFVRDITGGQVEVFLSSNSKYEQPQVGKNINHELKRALWDAGVVILIYTLEDHDWSWCMWECGLADHPDSPDTNVIVLQCLKEKPDVFRSELNPLAWDKESLINFAYRFREADFFPGVGRPVTGFKEEELREKAERLHKNLSDLILPASTENWAAWPFLRLEVTRDLIDELNDADRQSTDVCDRLLEDARIAACSAGLPKLFGRANVTAGTLFAELVQDWADAHPNRDRDWLYSLTRQLLDGATNRTPRLKEWGRFRGVDGDKEYIPGVGRIKRTPAIMHFDCYFFGTSEVPRVSSRMVRRNHMYHIDLSQKNLREVNLQKLLGELDEREWNRMPILEDTKAKYIIHVSMIDRFIRQKSYLLQTVSDLTLEDLLNEQSMVKIFSSTFEVVSEDSTLDDVRSIMHSRKNCLDVFVTKNGSLEEAVEGWLTDRDLKEIKE